ncbi:hypothetical protein N866_14005 [Actinotalea ferrariae CF5-4]|uniref:DUF4233 domain-containing protein n=1 Tax=Actinotalea ferrariae CF5-4 TaxID=948458 RepID=A0A021VSA5_9CELL|nr:DUF4233 domain-containing protein [Actinotalea ferrariae]EYR61942.1 hypothetical protein N866_14005 [Actinotalea ferrariae CF5-4]
MSSETRAGAASSADPARPERARSARRQFAATILVLEAFVVFFATLVAFGLRVGDPVAVFVVGGTLSLAMVLVAGMLRWPAGYVAGSALQVPMVAVGFVVPLMFGVAAIFVVLWVWGLRLGARIDRERAERAAAEG